MKWYYMDDLKAFYFYRKLSGKDNKENRDHIKPFLLDGNKMDSVFMRFRNFESLNTGKGFTKINCSIKAWIQVYNSNLKTKA